MSTFKKGDLIRYVENPESLRRDRHLFTVGQVYTALGDSYYRFDEEYVRVCPNSNIGSASKYIWKFEMVCVGIDLGDLSI